MGSGHVNNTDEDGGGGCCGGSCCCVYKHRNLLYIYINIVHNDPNVNETLAKHRCHRRKGTCKIGGAALTENPHGISNPLSIPCRRRGILLAIKYGVLVLLSRVGRSRKIANTCNRSKRNEWLFTCVYINMWKNMCRNVNIQQMPCTVATVI